MCGKSKKYSNNEYFLSLVLGNLFIINLEKVEREEADGETLTIQQFQEESPLEIARMFAEQEGKSFDEDLIELFNQAVNTLDEE